LKTIVHLSDIHFTASGGGLARRNESLRVDVLNDLKEMAGQRGPAAAVVVTGDIAFSGLPAEYAMARDWLDKVAGVVGVARTSVLCVPGNHDVNRASIGPTGEAIRDLLRARPTDGVDPALDRYMAEHQLPILGPLANYNDFAFNYRCHIGVGGLPYWEADLQLDDRWLLTVRGITTVLCSDHRDARPNLVVGRTQATLPLDRPDRIYLVLAHHPPDWYHDQERVLDALRHRASVLLCGHKHAQRIEQVDDMLRVVAGAVHPEEGQGWEPRYNFLEFEPPNNDPPELKVRVYPRVFSETQNRFIAEVMEKKEFQEFSLALPQRTAATEVHSVQPDSSEGSHEELPIPTAAVRPPLVEQSGAPEPERDMVRAFLDLTYPEQMGILQRLGLLEEDDRDKGFVALANTALARARERGLEPRLKEEVLQVAGRHSQSVTT
jgi:predicted MPP superfamily phosphohydrolase